METFARAMIGREREGQHRRRSVLEMLIVLAFSVEFLGVTSWLASRKPFWTDELHVVNLATAPGLDRLFAELLVRPDAMPPLVYYMTYFIGHAWSINHLTARLPAIFGFWLLCITVFEFLRRRVTTPLAAVGMLLPTTVTFAYGYALEARGYGLMMGFSGLAMWCWDRAGDRRPLAYIGLGCSLAAAVASHLSPSW